MIMGKQVFVTVGTTKFDSLINQVITSGVLKTLHSKGFSEIKLQIGRSELDPTATAPVGKDIPSISYYHFKDTIVDDVNDADLIISHAGIGSIMDVLGRGKPLLVVINEELMDNHQIEVAERLAKDSYLFYCTVSELEECLVSLDLSGLKPFPPGQPQKLNEFLNNMFGFV